MAQKLIYGWKPDIPDYRDIYYASPQALQSLPPAVDLTNICPSIYNQGRIGSCTPNTLVAAYQVCQVKQGKQVFMPSRLFLYYNSRAATNSVAIDSGASIRESLKSLANHGVCTEGQWSYNDTPANPITGRWPSSAKPAKRPPSICYSSALANKAISYFRINQTLSEIKRVLAEGFPIAFGFAVYTQFESSYVAKTGMLNLPQAGERMLGGHAVLLVGYNDNNSRFIARNSWGTGWGNKGYFTMPYDYVTNANLSGDFWVIRTISN